MKFVNHQEHKHNCFYDIYGACKHVLAKGTNQRLNCSKQETNSYNYTASHSIWQLHPFWVLTDMTHLIKFWILYYSAFGFSTTWHIHMRTTEVFSIRRGNVKAILLPQILRIESVYSHSRLKDYLAQDANIIHKGPNYPLQCTIQRKNPSLNCYHKDCSVACLLCLALDQHRFGNYVRFHLYMKLRHMVDHYQPMFLDDLQKTGKSIWTKYSIGKNRTRAITKMKQPRKFNTRIVEYTFLFCRDIEPLQTLLCSIRLPYS